MAKFKVGDRVRRFEASIWPTEYGALGKEYTVLEVNDHGAIRVIDLPGESNNFATAGSFDLVPAITLETGKHYRLRNGKVTGRVSIGDIGFEAIVDGQVKVFDKAGGAVFGGEDIVEAWVPKVGERVKCTLGLGEATVSRVDKDGRFTVNWGNGDIGTTRWKAGKDFEPLLVAAPAQPAVWVPAVGDKVVWLEPFKASMYTKGKEYLIHKKERGSLFITDDNDNPEHGWSDDNILRSFSLAVPLKIEAGRYYKTRDGRKVGPIGPNEGGLADYPWQDNSDWTDCWTTDGHFYNDGTESQQDIIAEWIDEPVAQPTAQPTASNDNAAPAKPKFKVGDRVVAVGDENDVGTVTKYADGLYAVAWSSHGSRPHDDLIWGDDELVAAPAPTTAIVAIVEDGVAKPSSKPKVHASQADATAEAERLALAHPGQLFGVFVLADSKIADVVNVPTPVLRAA